MDKLDAAVRIGKKNTNILERPLNKGRNEVHISAFTLLFSEIVQYSQNRVATVADLQTKLSDLGDHVGSRILDLLVLREKGYKRETRIINILLFIKTTVWKSLFGKEADKLEQSNDDDKTYYIIEKEPLVNTFISRPKDKEAKKKKVFTTLKLEPEKTQRGLNCAYFIAGIVEAILFGCNFHSKVTAHWHKGTTFMIQFEESVVTRDKAFDSR